MRSEPKPSVEQVEALQKTCERNVRVLQDTLGPKNRTGGHDRLLAEALTTLALIADLTELRARVAVYEAFVEPIRERLEYVQRDDADTDDLLAFLTRTQTDLDKLDTAINA